MSCIPIQTHLRSHTPRLPPSTQPVYPPHLQVRRPECFLCTNSQTDLFSSNFAITFVTTTSAASTGRNNQHHIVRMVNRNQYKVVQPPRNFRVIPNCTISMIIVKILVKYPLCFSFTNTPRLHQSCHGEQTHTLQFHCLGGRSMIHMIERLLHVPLYHNNVSLPFSRQFCNLQHKNNPTSACVFGTNAVCTLSYFNGGDLSHT